MIEGFRLVASEDQRLMLIIITYDDMTRRQRTQLPRGSSTRICFPGS